MGTKIGPSSRDNHMSRSPVRARANGGGGSLMGLSEYQNYFTFIMGGMGWDGMEL